MEGGCKRFYFFSIFLRSHIHHTILYQSKDVTIEFSDESLGTYNLYIIYGSVA